MRYLFCSLASLGFLGPSMAIAQELRQRGHDVAFVTGPSMAPFLHQMHMKRIPNGPMDGDSFVVTFSGVPLETIRQVRHIEYALAQFSPDVLVGQPLAFGPFMASERHHLPLAVIGLAVYLWPTEACSASYDDSYCRRVVKNYHEFLAVYESCCKLFGLAKKTLASIEPPFDGDLLLLQSVPALEGDAQSLPQRVHFVGNCGWNPPQADADLQRWREEAVASGEPIIYVQVGRLYNSPDFWDLVFDVLGHLPIRVAASVGRFERPITAIPENFFLRDHVPLGHVLPYAQAAICSSTTTAVLGALTHGLPSLLIPGSGGEQYDVAVRCQRAHVSLCLYPQDITRTSLEYMVQELLHDTNLRQNAQKMQSLFLHAGGYKAAANLLVVLGEKRAPILRHDRLSETEVLS